MSALTPNAEESTDVRDKRARWEGMEIVVADAERGIVNVKNVSKSDPSVYSVRIDGDDHTCTCPDWKHRQPEGGCKHIRRVRGEEAVIRAIRTARLRTDGGTDVGADDGDDVGADDGDDGACEACAGLSDELKCWACFEGDSQ